MTTLTTGTRHVALPIPVVAGVGAVLALVAGAAGVGSSLTTGGAQEYGPGVVNHPVGVVPSGAVSVPSGWPLNDEGAITCLTCHTRTPISRKEAGPKLRDFDSTTTRRVAFCAKCHRQTNPRSARSIHWLALGAAHIPSDRADVHAGAGLFDAQTRQCLSCHDGASASESNNITPWTRRRGYMGDRNSNHPIAVEYGDRSRPTDLTPLRQASLLPREIALPGGKVGCVSCHNLYARTRDLLTVPIQGSELCLTCHDMR